MTYLPRLASVAQACEWLAGETGEEWTLQRLMEYRLRPYFWLEHHPDIPQLTGGRPEGVMVEMVFAGDIQRLEFDGAKPFVTMFRIPDGRYLKTDRDFTYLLMSCASNEKKLKALHLNPSIAGKR